MLPWRTQIENCFLSKSNIGLHTTCTYKNRYNPEKSNRRTHTLVKNQKPAPKCTMILLGYHLPELLPYFAAHFELGFGPKLPNQTPCCCPPPATPHPQAQSGLFRWPATSLKSFLDEICFQILTANFSSIFFFILHPICLCSLTTISKFCILFLFCKSASENRPQFLCFASSSLNSFVRILRVSGLKKDMFSFGFRFHIPVLMRMMMIKA